MLNQKSIDLIKSFEGCRLACYHLGDGVCTIGYGHTRPLSQCAGPGTWTISQQQAEDFLQNDLARYRNAVMGYFTRNLNENQIGALTSFCYNLGTGIFARYDFPKNGTDSEITNQMMLFLNKGTQFEAGITRRRQAETALFLDGAVSNVTNKNSATSTPKKGLITMYLIYCIDTKRYYLSTGSEIKYIKTTRVLEWYQKNLGLPTDKMYQAEIDAEFGAGATAPSRDVSKG